ncbi:uncharacterized protein MELLADRAFT_63352 [Melampsora larici-populina 98AG31]|uniref:Uncharacterized protein n=1 Tax=Melampsora larici-populina (strain 98AG31 / pathotype 3-4-7) TaxID=747676 RepID=F4RMC7_MELLP|nr:uncharacterized protein MELLADRAFT_63352 [Melampsora larici-populina 98AG31]EGG06405.1 hypothetical protein MELLADRAFT_63352 [Melampsora larici-populina 98AG31]
MYAHSFFLKINFLHSGRSLSVKLIRYSHPTFDRTLERKRCKTGCKHVMAVCHANPVSFDVYFQNLSNTYLALTGRCSLATPTKLWLHCTKLAKVLGQFARICGKPTQNWTRLDELFEIASQNNAQDV